MIAVQTLWSGGDKEQDFDLWLQSNRALNRFYEKTILFADEGGRATAESVGLEYSEVRALPTYPESMERAWSIGKLYAAGAMTEPFLHVDGDVVLHRRLDAEADFICQGAELWICARAWWKRLAVAPLPMPSTPPMSYNFGIFGGQAWEAIARACRTAHDFALAHRFAIATACPNIMPAVVIEQIWVPAMLAQEGIIPACLLQPNRWSEADFEAAGFSHWIPHHNTPRASAA